jgi:hypothetical protein
VDERLKAGSLQKVQGAPADHYEESVVCLSTNGLIPRSPPKVAWQYVDLEAPTKQIDSIVDEFKREFAK